ncbi:MAG TPA: DinB family protein [Chitinophagaceae bacterium]|nr:DinB family protein [Chitinophagaceae bacterium]
MNVSSSISTRLEYQHKSLVDLIDGLTDEQIRRQVINGKWSIFENIAHLTAYQHAFIDRVKHILHENNPVLHRYMADTDPLFLDYCVKTTHEVMKDLLGTRKEMAAVFLSFKPEDYQKPGQHPAFGQMTLLQWMNFFLLHEAHHLFTIFKLAAELKKS